MFNMTNPYNEQQMLILEQELKHREEKGIYQTPSWIMRGGAILFIVLIILAVAIVVFYWL